MREDRVSLAILSQVALAALLSSRLSTATSVALVALSVVCVVGADQSFHQLAGVVQRLADGEAGLSARIDVSRCAACESAFAHSRLLQTLVQRSAHTTVRVHRSDARAIRARQVPVRCTPSWETPRAVEWHDATARRVWSQQVGVATVLVGADLAAGQPAGTTLASIASPDGSFSGRNAGPRVAPMIGTALGAWHRLGVLRPRPLLSASAGENGSLLVPWRAPFDRLCGRGRIEWRVAAADSIGLRRAIDRVEDELRTLLHLRPASRGPWRVDRLDRFDVLVQRMVRRFSRWVLAVPITIAVLSGAGVFSVQALEGAARMQEFGVRRAMGATRRLMVWQLVMEMLVVSAAGVAVACLLLAALGAFTGAGAVAAWRGVVLAVVVAVPTCAVGVLLPGLSALHASSIASLEGRTT